MDALEKSMIIDEIIRIRQSTEPIYQYGVKGTIISGYDDQRMRDVLDNIIYVLMKLEKMDGGAEQ